MKELALHGYPGKPLCEKHLHNFVFVCLHTKANFTVRDTAINASCQACDLLSDQPIDIAIILKNKDL